MINSRSCALGEKSFRNGEEKMLKFMHRYDPKSNPLSCNLIDRKSV